MRVKPFNKRASVFNNQHNVLGFEREPGNDCPTLGKPLG